MTIGKYLDNQVCLDSTTIFQVLKIDFHSIFYFSYLLQPILIIFSYKIDHQTLFLFLALENPNLEPCKLFLSNLPPMPLLSRLSLILIPLPPIPILLGPLLPQRGRRYSQKANKLFNHEKNPLPITRDWYGIHKFPSSFHTWPRPLLEYQTLLRKSLGFLQR